jgi:hypothetical protein
VCGGGTPKICPPASDQCHVVGTCDPSDGSCSNPTASDNTPCNSGQCTTTDSCQGGTCVSSGPMCDPGMCDVNGMCI